MIVDRAGDDHSLARQLSGVKAAEVRARMGDVDRAALPSVAEARDLARCHWESANSDSGGNAPQPEPELQPEPEQQETPLSDFDALMLETRRQAALLHPVPEQDEPEASPIPSDSPPETAARSAFDDGKAETIRRAARLAAAETAMPEDERRKESWEAWKANLRHHLLNMRGKILEWWREYFGFEEPDNPQRGVER